MYVVHEGEIIFKEKYGSSPRERYYVKPPDQANIVTIESGNSSEVTNWFTRVFLPQGYPDSVSKDYINYQIWDTAQAFCSTITGILATQEVLRGVGVGDTNATPLAATITWVLKDGCGHMGRILFAYSHGTYLDAYSKKWRLYADTLNDAAMCIEIALPLFKNYTTFALCISTVMKAIVGVAGGATRAAMTQHHAVRGNLADVSAKDSSQETAVNLIASFAALLILGMFGNSLIIFIVMMILHIICNYFAVRAVCLRTLNEPRFLTVMDDYLRKEIISSPCEVNRTEPIFFYQLGSNLLDLKLCGFQIKMGYSLKKIVQQNPKAINMTRIKNVYKDMSYALIPNIKNRQMYILYKDDAENDDILCGYFHAVLLSIVTCAINDYDLVFYSKSNTNQRPFAEVCHTLQTVGWSREPGELSARVSNGFLHEPSTELMVYLNKIAQDEWYRVRAGLRQIGWDLSKHLLITDEWRICTEQKFASQISREHLVSAPSVLRHASKVIFDELIPEAEETKEEEDEYTIEPEKRLTAVVPEVAQPSEPTKPRTASKVEFVDIKTTDKKLNEEKQTEIQTPEGDKSNGLKDNPVSKETEIDAEDRPNANGKPKLT